MARGATQFGDSTNIPERSGSLRLGKQEVFWKLIPTEYLIREIDGYKSVSRHFPVPKLYGSSKLGKGESILFFQYDDSVGEEKGLLVDLFATRNNLDKDFVRIIKMYREVFLKTLSKSKSTASNIFFSERMRNRIPAYYSRGFLSKDFDFALNGRSIHVNLGVIVKEMQSFFSKGRNELSVVSQCDPNDLNIGIKPILFDYTAGGKVPLMAEFATLFWYQLAQGDYFSLKYNASAFKRHKRIYKRMNKVLFSRGNLKHNPEKLRILFLREYVKQVIKPCLAKTPAYTRWFDEFKNYLAMKIIGVFDVSKMSEKDLLLSLGYLDLFYHATDINDVEDLFKLID